MAAQFTQALIVTDWLATHPRVVGALRARALTVKVDFDPDQIVVHVPVGMDPLRLQMDVSELLDQLAATV